MKKYFVYIALLLLQVQIIRGQDTIRIMTINIDQGVDTTLQYIGEVIRSYNPDLVSMQEVDMYPKRSTAPRQFGKNFMAELGYFADMQGVFGKAFDHPGGWDYGDAILSKYSFSESASTILKHQKNTEPRQLLLIHTNIKGHDICFASTHLSHENKANRADQLKQIRQIMQRRKEKIKFVCGDLNSDTSENLVLSVMKHWRDALPDNEGTFSSAHGQWHYKAYKYDYILYRCAMDKKIEVIQTIIRCNEEITDHCICIADIVIR